MIEKVEMSNVEKNKENTLRLMKNIKAMDLIIGIISLLISRATIMDELTPFGVSFVIAYTLKYKRNLIVPLVSSIGLIGVHGKASIPYLITIWAIFSSRIIVNKENQKNIVKIGIYTVALFVSSKSIYIFINDYYLYDLIMTIFESIIIFTLLYVFNYGINTMKKGQNRVFTNEEIICGAIMIALSISGLKDIEIYGASLKNAVGIAIVIMFAYNKGTSVGSTVGITIGVVTSMSQSNLPIVISAYGFSGLLSGLFRDLGKIGSSIGFIIGSFIISFYIDGSIDSLINLKEGIAGIAIFFVFSKLMKSMNGNMVIGVSKSTQIEEAYSSRLRDMTHKRLSEISQVFKELSITFEKVSDKRNMVQQNDISKLIDKVANEVCSNCAVCKFCWEEDFYITYQLLFEMTSEFEINGSIDMKNMSPEFTKRCNKPDLIVDKINYFFQMYKLGYRWEEKILESRQLVSQQLGGIASIIDDLANQIHENVKFKQDVERSIYTSLRNMGMDILEVIVTETDNDDFEIFLEIDQNCESYRLRSIPKLVSEIVGIELTADKFYSNTYSDGGNIKLKLLKGNRFAAITKVCRLDEGFNYISGDSYTFGERKNNYYVALSDGMGMGHRANQESTITISLLEKFLEAGFDKELALKTINSILVLKSTDEMSTTIDMTVIDLYRGSTKFVKIGSAPTFIKRRGLVQVIDSHTMPAGILKDVDIQVYEDTLEDGDFIITVSDGVLDANEDTDDKEKWLSCLIENIKSENPQTIADKIIDHAIAVSEESKRDDMTVLVTKFWKRV